MSLKSLTFLGTPISTVIRDRISSSAPASVTHPVLPILAHFCKLSRCMFSHVLSIGGDMRQACSDDCVLHLHPCATFIRAKL